MEVQFAKCLSRGRDQKTQFSYHRRQRGVFLLTLNDVRSKKHKMIYGLQSYNLPDNSFPDNMQITFDNL